MFHVSSTKKSPLIFERRDSSALGVSDRGVGGSDLLSAFGRDKKDSIDGTRGSDGRAVCEEKPFRYVIRTLPPSQGW